MKVSKKHMRIKHQLTIKGCSEKVLGGRGCGHNPGHLKR